MRELPKESIDAIVTDPPYNLGFMGKGWDKTGVAFEPATWREALRVLEPGGHLVAFGGSRTFHRLTCAIEDAGFEIRDCLSWLYGTGFPKSLDVSKAIDGALGAKRPVLAESRQSGAKFKLTQELIDNGGFNDSKRTTFSRTGPATPESIRWSGWGTGLKPAWEPVMLARKRLVGTVAENVLRHGTGGLNIDGCRIGSEHYQGRWPPNVSLDEEAAQLLEAQVRAVPGQVAGAGADGESEGGSVPRALRQVPERRGDLGIPSRFLYVAKASRVEREAGCNALAPRSGAAAVERRAGDDGLKSPRAGAGRTAKEIRNHHPTVKPIELMRWLVRLVTPPDGTVLDPFAGSGTTGCAAIQEGLDFIGSSRTPNTSRSPRPGLRRRSRARRGHSTRSEMCRRTLPSFAGSRPHTSFLPPHWTESHLPIVPLTPAPRCVHITRRRALTVVHAVK